MLRASLLAIGLLAGPLAAEGWTPGLVYPSSGVADLLSTRAALSQPDTKELNPLARSLKGQVAVKALTVSGMILLDLKLQQHGRHRAAWVVRGGWILLHGFVISRNLRAAHRR